ncbi:MAG TPA: DNA-formamidopyrimidine glycosylase family protein [Actinomycetota bacterium]|nr:DNA-formamidopyrimidine glycosylase family protein [Actinomycetota bacterium]
MPEGDTVLVAAGRLHAALAGERLLATDFRVPRFATLDLSGQTVREVVARGKHLLLRTDAGVTLHSHLKMEGAWHLYRPRERWRGPDFQVRVVLRTEPWVAVGFRLGVCELLPTAREHEVVGHLGPDVLGADWDAAEAVRRLLADPGRAVGNALLDQRVLAGPGNIYKCEVCFLRGVDPWTPVGQVDDLAGMVDLLKRLMEANRGGGRQITTGDTRPGRTHWVAGRTGRPCRRCGTPIRMADQESYDADRVTWWCPTCQPGQGPPLRSARTSAPRRGGRGGEASGRSG